MRHSRRIVISAMAGLAAIPLFRGAAALAATGTSIDATLKKLYAEAPMAKELSKTAKGILVFPKITKAGLMVGGAYGEGVLRKGGVNVARYKSVAASYGLQAGAQTFGYALFFMNNEAMTYLDNSDGWEIGSGPSFVAVDKGMAKKYSSSTLTKDIYAFIFGQKGLMAGIGLEGSKITKIK